MLPLLWCVTNGKVLPLRDGDPTRDCVSCLRPKLSWPARDYSLRQPACGDGRVLSVRSGTGPDARVVYVDPRVAAARSDEVLNAADRAPQVVVAVYVVLLQREPGR